MFNTEKRGGKPPLLVVFRLQIEESVAAQELCNFTRRRHTSRSRGICRTNSLSALRRRLFPTKPASLGFGGGPRAGLSKASANRSRSYRLKKASLPRNCATSPSSSSMRSSWLYLATRSVREGAPVLIWPAFRATEISAMVVSSVSPER